uniref:Uncharacterized protein n=1 Tax=Candidozyma auris TaxID=498019 RepID=A0A0L0P568_CANAR
MHMGQQTSGCPGPRKKPGAGFWGICPGRDREHKVSGHVEGAFAATASTSMKLAMLLLNASTSGKTLQTPSPTTLLAPPLIGLPPVRGSLCTVSEEKGSDEELSRNEERKSV